jgi:hypothetical protein
VRSLPSGQPVSVRRHRVNRTGDEPVSLSTHRAYQCNSGHFGQQVSPAAWMLRFNEETKEWFLCAGKTGNPILRSKNKTEIEALLDRMERRR